MLPGITGTLISQAFLEHRLLAALGSEPLEPGVAHASLAAWWRGVRDRCGPATSVRQLVDVAATPLAALLGFHLERSTHVDADLWLCEFVRDERRVPVLVVPWTAALHGSTREAVRAALAVRSRWCLLVSGRHVRLLDAGSTSARRHLDFDVEAVADDEHAAAAMARLLQISRFGADEAATPSLARIVAMADADGVRLCTGLRAGVHQALEHLCEALAQSTGRRFDPVAIYDEALTGVYRLLFLFFAEARGLVPAWHPVYREAYTMDALRRLAEGPGPCGGLWAAFQAMSRLAYEGCEAGDLRVSAFNGGLFSAARAPRLEHRRLDDRCLRDAVMALSFTEAHGNRRERVAYRDLGVEELGSVYESLLDYEPSLQGPVGERGGCRVRLVRTTRTRRKETGTFYTPAPLTRHLVRGVLGPLVEGASPQAILALRVLDPAMGSGAFLVAACRFLGSAYESALVRDGACAATDIGDADRAGFRRLVAQRCLFGVDANPTAVQLARLSLWLTTLAADKPLGFLDHHLRSGDSLLGATLADLARRGPERPGRTPHAAQLPLFDPHEWQEMQRAALPIRRELEQSPDDTAAVVRRKDAVLQALLADGSREPWRALADLWCTRWLADRPARRAELDALASHLLHGRGPLGAAAVEPVMERARDEARAAHLFHWPLEFPEVFCDEQGRERSDGGFDAVVGNPPWEMLRADEGSSRARVAGLGVLRFARSSGVYHARSQGHSNQYQLFLERAVQLTRPGGRFGLVLPHGLATDQGAAPLRRLLFTSCATESIVGFENRRGIFPIHRSVRFLLVTAARGGSTGEIRCRFGLQDPVLLDGLSERPPREALPIVLTRGMLARLSGDELAVPDVRSTTDLQIAEKLCAMWPRLSSREGWHARFGRELNATDDRGHFTEGGAGLPIIDGRHVTPFRTDSGASRLRISPAAAARLLDEGRTWGRARLAFRDVASASNKTTLIAAIVPAGCVTTHTLFCLRTAMTLDDQWRLCALLNSFVANFFVRLRVSSHVSLSIVHGLPVPRLDAGSERARRLAQWARHAAAGGEEGRAARAGIQALAAHAYALTAGEFDHVLASFPLVDQPERDAARAAFTRESPR